MAKVTRVYYEGNKENNRRIFRTNSRKIRTLWVTGFRNGIITVEPLCGNKLQDFAEVIAGCFIKRSNFATEVKKAYTCDINSIFTAIRFAFNEITITVTEENADKDTICWEYHDKLAKRQEQYYKKQEAWFKTPEGQDFLAKQKAIEAEVLHIDETVYMEFKTEKAKRAWEKIVKTCSQNSYDVGIVDYARRWAKCMQKLIDEGQNVFEIAEKTSQDCDIEGITGYMYGRAVSLLSECWKYGEELRKWHNEKYGKLGV